MSTNCTHVDNFISSPTDRTSATFTAIQGARKTHKSLPNGREAVWPQHLEMALIRGLERYRPAGKSGLRPNELQRFPKRNKKISDYIYQETGVKRTPKQVGSRLQQMKETVKDPRVQRLLTSKEYDDFDGDDDASNTPSTSASATRVVKRTLSTVSSDGVLSRDCQTPVSEASSATASSALSTPSSPSAYRSLYPVPEISVQLDVTPVNYSLLSQLETLSPSSDASIVLDLDEQHIQSGCRYSPFTSPQRWASVRAEFAPQISFNSSSLLPKASYRSVSTVYCNGDVVYSDADHAVFLQPFTTERLSGGRVATLFRTYLVPDFWGMITENLAGDVQYTIIQTITQVTTNSSSALAGALLSSPVVCTIKYAVNNTTWTQGCQSPEFPTYSSYPTLLSSPGYDGAGDHGYFAPAIVPSSSLPASPSFHPVGVHDFPIMPSQQLSSATPYANEGHLHYPLSY